MVVVDELRLIEREKKPAVMIEEDRFFYYLRIINGPGGGGVGGCKYLTETFC